MFAYLASIEGSKVRFRYRLVPCELIGFYFLLMDTSARQMLGDTAFGLRFHNAAA